MGGEYVYGGEVKSHQMYNINFIIEFHILYWIYTKQFVGAPRGKFKFSQNFPKLFPTVELNAHKIEQKLEKAASNMEIE